MPVTADSVAQHVFKFRTVEGAFAGIDRSLDAVIVALRLDLRKHRRHHALGVFPHLVGADPLIRPGRQFDREFAFESKIGVSRQDQIVDLEALVGELRFRAKNMRVILRKSAHPHQPVHRTGGLVAMHYAEFGQAQRQVAIALQSMLEDLHMPGTVHWF